jgi:tape measure domain-containing protein
MSEGNVQLKLKASLDLDFLRAQVASLGRSLKTTGFSVVATLDTDQIKKDVAKLTKEVKIKVNDSALDGLSDRIDKAQLRLKELQSESSNVVIGVTGRAAVTQKDARKIRADVYRGIMQNGGKILLPVGLRPISQTAVDAFKTDLRQKLGSITVNVQAQLESAAVRKGAKTPAEIDAEVRRGLQAISEMGASRMAGGGAGGVTETARKESLRKSIEDLTVAQLRQVAKQLEVGGASKLRRADLINKIVADASVEMVKKYLDPQAMMRGGDRGQLQKVLDTFARGVFNMLGMDPASVRAKRLPAAINWPAQVPERRIPIGPSSTGRALPGAAAATMLPGTRLGDQKQLVGDILSPSLKEILRGAANAFADSVRREMNAAVRSVSVRDFGNAIRQIPMLSAAAPQGALPAGRSGGALAVQSELTDFYRVVEVQVRNTFNIIEDYHKRQAQSFANSYKKVIEDYHTRALFSVVRSMRVTDFGGPGRPLLTGGRDPLMLPSAGGTSAGLNRPPVTTGSFTGRGYEPPGGFPSDTRPLGGRQGPATFIGPGGAMAQWKAALKGAEEAMSGFQTNSIPFIGGLKSIAMELGQATKQVLLYGTAYKGLAFITSLPGQIFNAAKAQQQYNNSLKVVTESTGTYAKELLYVDQIQRTFGLDLQATRKGFTDLYASMAPTGFDSGSIEKLFTGISAASAALQLTPATMDRVIYAFAQMASKGQIMSEELKRQLGDALPGALGIFANAAGMSLQEFNKAMEAGEFTGNKFRETIAKVTDELIDRFGSGAQEAGKSLQGLTNVIKGDFVRTLEALAPLVNSVAQATLIPLGNALKQFASATSIAMGEMDRLGQQIEKQKQLIGELQVAGVDSDQIKKAEVALLALQSRYEALNIALEDPAVKQQAENIKVFVKQLQELGTIAMNVANGIGSVLTPIMTFFGLNLSQTVVLITSVVLGFNAMKLAIQVAAFTLSTFNKIVLASAAGEVKVKLLQMAFQALGAKISMATLRAFEFGVVLKALIASTGIGAVVVALGLLAAGFASVGNSARKAAEESKASIQAIKEAVAGGNVALIEMKVKGAKVDIEELDALSEEFEAQGVVPGATVERRKKVAVSKEQAARALAVGLDLKPGEISQGELNRLIAARKKLRQDELEVGNLAMAPAVARRAALGLEDPNLGVVPEEADGDEGARQKALDQAQRDAERLASQQQQLTIANAELENKKDEFTFATRSQLLDDEFEQRKSLVDSFYDYEIAGANEIIGVRLKLEKQLASIRMGAMKTYQDSLRRMEEGRLKIALAERTRTAATAASQIEPSGGAAATGGAIFGDTGRTFNAQGWVHGHFQNMNREALVADTVETVMALLSQGVPTELGSGEKFTQGMSQQQIEEIVRRGIASHKKYESGIGAVDIFVPEGTSVPVPVSGVSNMGGSAGVGGNLARGTQLMHLDPRSTSGGALSGTAFSMARREQKTELSVEAAEAEQAELARRLLSTTETEFSKARDAARVAVAEMLGTVMPVEQLKLENQLLEERGRLMLQSIPEEVIQMEEDRFKAMAKGQQIQSALKTEIEFYEFALDAANKAIKAGGPDLEQYEQLAKQLQKTINGLKGELDGIEPAFNAFNVELAKSTLQALQNADALKAMQETVETIEQAVEGAMSAYKGFAAEVISGGSLKDAASKMQQALKDQAVTMFLDFALKPMEQFMEDGLKKMFGIPSEDEKRKEQIAKLQEQINATKLNTDAINANTAAQGGQAPASPTANVPGVGNTPTSSLFSMGGLGSQAVNAPMAIDIAAFGGASSAIDSLNESVYSMGDAIPSFKDSLGNITDTVYKASEETNAQGATFSENLGKAVGAIGIAATSVMGIAAGIGQIKEGGASNVLGGIGSVLLGIGGAMGGFGKLFPGKAAANGAVWQGGFTAFANGGVVNGPTLGLVGEGKYNEAIVPLPDGRSIPVKMAGSSSRDLINNQSSSQSSSPVLSMSFETTRFGDVDYVNVEQLQRAMEETRRVAVRDGASRGASTALDRLQNSPAARRKIGLR